MGTPGRPQGRLRSGTGQELGPHVHPDSRGLGSKCPSTPWFLSWVTGVMVSALPSQAGCVVETIRPREARGSLWRQRG